LVSDPQVMYPSWTDKPTKFWKEKNIRYKKYIHTDKIYKNSIGIAKLTFIEHASNIGHENCK
jgi:hypothetical protein